MAFKINNRSLVFKSGQTILEVARQNGITIPSLCYHPDFDVKANCRLCAVEIKGSDKLVTACSTLARDGLAVFTESERVIKARKLNLELIIDEHTKKCGDCTSAFNCELLKFSRDYKIDADRFFSRKQKRQTYKFGQAVELDSSQCVDCRNCVDACRAQGIDYLEIIKSGHHQEIVPSRSKNKTCVYCGQCALHCPAASAQEIADWPAVEKILQDKKKIVVAQFAPSVRVSVGEEFGLAPGTNCEGQMISALKKLGFKWIFDTNFGADITTMVEAEELIERLDNKKAVWPMFTSCCPAWVAYVEFYHPKLIPNLTSARSPQLHLAAAVKTYWAHRRGINPKNIIMVSIMPCTAKKQEISRPQLKANGRQLVDYVLTVREFAYLLKRKQIDLSQLPVMGIDSPFNQGSGAAAIYGASGGVMESALRTAAAKLSIKSSSKSKVDNLKFKDVPGLTGFKEASLELTGKKLRVGIVNGLGNFAALLPKLAKYHYIEVMACPGGCLGGGGQPLKINDKIRIARRKGLYALDEKRPQRCAHENKAMLTCYDYLQASSVVRGLLHTKFNPSRVLIPKTLIKKKKKVINRFI